MKATLEQFKEFRGSAVYQDLLRDLLARKSELRRRVIRGGDDEYSDDRLRGRMDFIEYALRLTDEIIHELEVQEAEKAQEALKTNKKEKEDE